MGNMYNLLKSLCDERGITGYKMCKDCGIQPSVMTDLKMERRFGLKAETASKISSYFSVPINFLTEQPPFDMWKSIDSDRNGYLHFFFRFWERPVEDIQNLFQVNPENPESAPVSVFVRFVDATVKKAYLESDGEWSFEVKDICKKQNPAANARGVSDDDIKFALFGGANVTDAQFEEVKRFARYIAENNIKPRD